MNERVERLKFNPNINIMDKLVKVTSMSIKKCTICYIPIEYILMYLEDSSCKVLKRTDDEIIIDIDTFLTNNGHMTFGGLIDMSITIGEYDRGEERTINETLVNIIYNEGLSINNEDKKTILSLVKENYRVCDICNKVKEETPCSDCKEEV